MSETPTQDRAPAEGEHPGRGGEGGEFRRLAEAKDLVHRGLVRVGGVVEHLGHPHRLDDPRHSGKHKRQNVIGEPWLHRVLPRLSRTEIAQHQRVLTDIRARGYGAWRFDDTHQSLHHRLASVLASLQPTVEVSRQLTTLMTMVTLRSVTDKLETELAATEFVVLPIFGQDGQPEYQIEIHLGRSAGLTLGQLDAALRHAQELLAALP
jgi:hypothetical protein